MPGKSGPQFCYHLGSSENKGAPKWLQEDPAMAGLYEDPALLINTLNPKPSSPYKLTVT